MKIFYNITIDKRNRIVEQYPTNIFIQKYSDEHGYVINVFNLGNGRIGGGGYKAEGIGICCGDIGEVGFGRYPIINHFKMIK